MEGHKLEHFQNLGTKNETCAKFRDENNLLTKKKKKIKQKVTQSILQDCQCIISMLEFSLHKGSQSILHP